MSNSDKAMKELEKLADYYGNDVEDWEIGIYIKQQEQLAKDVTRFIELDDTLYLQGWHSKEETVEYQELRYKLSKIGKEI